MSSAATKRAAVRRLGAGQSWLSGPQRHNVGAWIYRALDEPSEFVQGFAALVELFEPIVDLGRLRPALPFGLFLPTLLDGVDVLTGEHIDCRARLRASATEGRSI